MPSKLEKLLVLKAFHLGHGIINAQSRVIAQRWVECAIRTYRDDCSEEGQVRLLFYRLLKAVLARGSEGVIDARREAKALSDNLGGQLFELLMKIESVTRNRSMALAADGSPVDDTSGQARARHADASRVLDFNLVDYYAALKAVDLDPNDMTASDQAFLYKLTLTQLLNQHDVSVD